MPKEAGLGASALGAMLGEADAYCTSGEVLLTLRTPPGALACRRWLLGQFTEQLNGAAPVSWPEWAAQHAPDLV